MAETFYVSEYPGSCDDEKISACLKDAISASEPTVVFSGRDFVIGRAVLLFSGLTVIIDNCTVRQADRTFDNVFRGKNIHLNGSDPFSSADSIDKLENVKLLGRGNAVIEGCGINRRAYHPVLKEEQDMLGDYWGFRGYQVLFVCTDKLEISGLKFTKTRSWAVTIDLCTNIHIHDIDVQSDVKNGDGIHLLSGCSYGVIERITGITSDDTVAVESGFRLPCLPYKNYLASFTPAEKLYDNYTTEQLGCHDLVIRNIKSGGKMHSVILLPLNGTTISNVTIEDITDTCRQEPFPATVFLYTGLYGGIGTLRDISVKRVDSLADTVFVSNTTITNLLLSDLKTRKENGKLYGTFPHI